MCLPYLPWLLFYEGHGHERLRAVAILREHTFYDSELFNVMMFASVCMFKQKVGNRAWGFTNIIEPKYVYIRLEVLSSTHLPGSL